MALTRVFEREPRLTECLLPPPHLLTALLHSSRLLTNSQPRAFSVEIRPLVDRGPSVLENRGSYWLSLRTGEYYSNTFDVIDIMSRSIDGSRFSLSDLEAVCNL